MHAAEKDAAEPPGATALAAAVTERQGAGAAAAQQMPVIRWERFLPRRSLRMLLVEHDDSTRQIVAALLRKCSYHVAAVADGLKAWEVLKQKGYKFDLVLTEVEMPSLSGIGLLSKIMGNEQSKNIPVIMMSSHDSVNVVFKCMLKGAVDFLVKPVRRNELKNLWQHVWRKHCSTSYTNGNESVNNNHTKSEELSGDNEASNNIIATNAIKSKEKEQCDQESETQSSGSKAETEIQSMRREEELIPNDDASSPVAMKANLDKMRDKMMFSKNGFKKDNSTAAEDKSARTGEKIISALCEPALTEKSKKQSRYNATSTCDQDIEILQENIYGNVASISHKAPEKNNDFVGVGSAKCIPAVANKDVPMEENQREHARPFPMENATTSDAPSSREVSLRESHINGCSKQGFRERHILKHSAASAFSRYSTGIRFSCKEDGSVQANTAIKTREQCAEVQPHYNNHGAESDKEERLPVSLSLRLASSHGNEREPSLHRRLDSVCNNEENECSALNTSRIDARVTHSSSDADSNILFSPRQLGMVSHPFPVRVPLQNMCSGYGAILPPLFCPGISTFSSAAIETAEDSRPHLSQHGNNQYDQFQQFNGNLHMHALEHGYRGHLTERHEDAGQFVFHDNRSGTCDRSNLHGTCGNGDDEMIDASAPPTIVPEFVNMNGFNNSSQDHNLSRREAALMKFRLKRKDRCFEKKVRYHSRKKLAEQRPRIKGQFVRQSTIESNGVMMEEDN